MTDTSSPDAPPRPTDTGVDAFLAAVLRGEGIPPALYAEDARLDATVPGWRFTRRGADAIAEAYASWFADPGRFEELERRPVPGGEVVTFVVAWEEDGVPHAAHHAHLLAVDQEGRITSDMVFCGGRWDAALLAQMAEADR